VFINFFLERYCEPPDNVNGTILNSEGFSLQHYKPRKGYRLKCDIQFKLVLLEGFDVEADASWECSNYGEWIERSTCVVPGKYLNNTYAHTHTHTKTCTYAQTRTHMHARTRVYTPMHAHTTDTHTADKHTHICTHARSCTQESTPAYTHHTVYSVLCQQKTTLKTVVLLYT